jgi:hypothetical protein
VTASPPTTSSTSSHDGRRRDAATVRELPVPAAPDEARLLELFSRNGIELL